MEYIAKIKFGVGDEEGVLEGLPKGTLTALFPHQVSAIKRASGVHQGRSLLALGMGSGKTLVACCLLNHYHERFSLVICPANKQGDWVKEYKQWTGKTANLLGKHRGDPLPGVTVTSTTTARLWLQARPGLSAFVFDCVVVDEAQSLKGDSQQAKVIAPVLHRARSCFLLTGTPVMNRPSELFNLLNALHPRVFWSRKAWVEEFSDGYLDQRFPIGPNAFRETGVKRGKEEELFLVMSAVMCRGGASDGPTLPALRRRMKTRGATAEADLAELKALRDEGFELAQAQRDAGNQREFDQATNAMKVAANSRWIKAGEIKARVFAPWLAHLLAVDHADEGVAVFCVHLETAAATLGCVRGVYPGAVLTTGETAEKTRDENIRRVSTGEVRVGVFTVGACGAGINLVPAVSVIVFMELPLTPAMALQTECRAHRIGQRRVVSSYWCELSGSQDQTTLRMLQSKQEACSVAVDGVSSGFEFE